MEIEDTAVRLALVAAEFLASAQADNLPDPLQCPLSGVKRTCITELAKVRGNFTPRVKGPVSPEVQKNFACASSIERPRRAMGGGRESCKREMNNALALRIWPTTCRPHLPAAN